MKTVFYSIICLIVSFNCIAQRNVILIIADDLGTENCGFYEGNVDTVGLPHIRTLLDKGVRFQNAVANPVCSPTRAGILTGRYSFRTGVGCFVPAAGLPGELDTAEITIPKLLHGYDENIAVAQVGKWHLQNEKPASHLTYPKIMGFTYYAGTFAGVNDYYNWSKVTNGIKSTVTNYATTEMNNDAINWIKSQNNNQFFLWLAFNAPHDPYHLPPAGMYSDVTLTGTPTDIEANPKKYFKADLEALDHEIGRLFDSLTVLNLMDSTDIIFIGDNGNVGSVAADPLRAKGTLYQGGVHVPFIISGPSVVNPGRVSSALVNTVDLFATILDLFGNNNWQSQIPQNKPVDSKSILPIVLNQDTSVRPWAFTEIFKNVTDSKDGKAIRNSDYKLMHFDNGVKKFYNLKNDPNEIISLLSTSLSDSDIINYNYLCNEMTTLVGGTTGCIAIISVAPTVTDVLCNGASTGSISLQVTGASAPYTYIWNDGVTTKDRSGFAAGTYTVTVTDSKFQSRKLLINVSQPNEVIIQSSTNEAACGGDIITNATGGSLPYSYLWNNNSTNSALTNVSPGLYIVRVTDNNGCTKIDSINLVNPNALSLSQIQTNAYCNSYFDGTATVIPNGGTPDYTYIWSNGQTNQTATGLTSTSYAVQVSDSNGCSAIRTFNISEINPLIATLSNSNTSCNTSCNGSANVATVSGDTLGLTYTWSNGQSTQTITSLCAGSYTVTISNSVNCTSSSAVSITDLVIQGVNTSQLSCNNPGSGIANAIVIGGTPPYSYLWSNGQTTQTATGLNSGSYTVTVTDVNGCGVEFAVPIIVSPPVFATTTFKNSTCSSNKGSVKIVPTGGKVPYHYQWNNGATTSSINNLPGGLYIVTVTDKAGCSLTRSTVLIATGSIPKVPGAITGMKTEVCAGLTNVNYSVALLTNTNSYLWTAPAHATIASGQGTNSVYINFDPLFVSGPVSVAAVNYCGSSIAKTATIKSYPSLPGTITGPISVCANQANVAYSIIPVAGATTYLWTKPLGSVFVSGQGTTNIVVNIGTSAGNISVKAGNACGYSNVKKRAISIVCREAANETGVNDLNVYPTPASDFINISFNSNLEGAYYVELKDLMGRVVNSLSANAQTGDNRTTMKVDNLTSGIYFLIIEINGVKTTRKIAVEKL